MITVHVWTPDFLPGLYNVSICRGGKTLTACGSTDADGAMECIMDILEEKKDKKWARRAFGIIKRGEITTTPPKEEYDLLYKAHTERLEEEAYEESRDKFYKELFQATGLVPRFPY